MKDWSHYLGTNNLKNDPLQKTSEKLSEKSAAPSVIVGLILLVPFALQHSTAIMIC
jgi:hypothetical protein